MAGGDEDAAGNGLDDPPHGPLFAQKDLHAADALPHKANGAQATEGGLPLLPVGDVPQHIQDVDTAVHREGRGAGHIVDAEQVHLITLGKEVGHADDGLFHAAYAQMQGDDVDGFFPGRGLRLGLCQLLDAADDLGVVCMQIIPGFGLAAGGDQGGDDILIPFQPFAVFFQILGAIQRQAKGLGLHHIQRLPLIAGGGDKSIHLVHVPEGVGLLAQEGDLIRQAQAVPLVLQKKALIPVADDVQVQIIPLTAGLGEGVQHDVIALLVAETANGNKVQFVGVGGKICGFPGLAVDFPGIDGVLNDGELGRVKDAGAGHERLDHTLGHTHEAVIILEFILKVIPQHPVFPLVLQFNRDIVMDPHDPALGRNGKGPQGAGELVGIEVHCQVILPAIPKVQADHGSGSIKRDKGADAGNVLQVLDIQLGREIHLPEGAPVRQVEIHLKMLIVKVPQEVHQRLLDAAHVKIILKECDPFHSDILTNHSYVVSFYRKSSIL